MKGTHQKLCCNTLPTLGGTNRVLARIGGGGCVLFVKVPSFTKDSRLNTMSDSCFCLWR